MTIAFIAALPYHAAMLERVREPALIFAWAAVSIGAWVVPHPAVRLVLRDLSWVIVVLTLVVAAVTSLVRALLRRRRGDAAQWRRLATDPMWAVIVAVALLMCEVASIAGVLQWLVLGHVGTRGGGGLVFGLVTGSGLAWLLRHRRAVTPSADHH